MRRHGRVNLCRCALAPCQSVLGFKPREGFIMRRTLLGIFIALVAGGPAGAVDIVNRDSTNHRVFVCGDGCKPDNTSPNHGVWIELAAGELKSNICYASCVFVVSDDGSIDPEDVAFGAEYSGSDVVAIKASRIVKDY